jgi:hypothetical protein
MFSAGGIGRLQSWLDPFLALATVLSPSADAALSPAYGFALAMLGLTILLNAISMWRLRVWNPSGEPIMHREAPEEVGTRGQKDRARAHAAPGAARPVWRNPIVWREIATRAYGRRPLLVKAAYFIVLALVAYLALGAAPTGPWAAAKILVPLGILSLLLVSAQAVTAITSERDLGALDLLLVTDITPREFIFGKLWGILYNTKEYLIPPLILAGIFAWRRMLASAPPAQLAGKNFEALLCVAIAILILFAFTMILGLHVGLGTANSRVAVLKTLGTVFILSIGTLICIYLILIQGRFEYQFLSFSGFIFAGIGGLWWVLCADRPSTALWVASCLAPIAVFYSVTNILIGKPGMPESSDPLIPLLVTGGAFSFAVTAMLVPLLSDFDVALGRTSAPGGE